MDATPAAADHPQRNGADVPAARTFGVGTTMPSPDGGATVTVSRSDETIDSRGALPVGVLGLAVDHALGGAIGQVIADDEVMITSHMHLELVRAPTPDVDHVVAHGEVVDKRDGHAFTRGRIESPDGTLLGLMSARFAILELAARAGGYVRSDPTPAPVGASGSGRAVGTGAFAEPVQRVLGMRVADAAPGRVTTTVVASAEIGNERQGLHGGVGVLIGERTIDHLVRTVTERPDGFRVVELRTVFLRPIAADGATIACRAEATYVGRSVITSRATLLTPAGKDAVVVDVIHAVGRDPR